ncbi:transposase [Rhizobium leguminosarum]|uniref:transposase n=1 Tax=Rhizobium leguminosarum TaxID=384 RepID=UPI0012BD1504|nr:transposase [Rhizobium leguminosarum]NEH46107.1 transposase [Rhizobium leguminosarum]
METTLEVLTTRKSGREVHRHWPDDVKAQIVSESLRPGAMVSEVAERHGLKPNHLSTWRTMARQGKLFLPAPEDPMEFAAVIVDPPVSEPPIKKASRPEIIVGSVTIRLKKVRQPLGSPLSRVPARFRHDLSVEPGPDHGRDQAGRLPQRP